MCQELVFQASPLDDSSGEIVPSRYLLKVGTTADCVVQTVNLLLIVGTDKGHLVMFDLSFLEEGRLSFHTKLGKHLSLTTNSNLCSRRLLYCRCYSSRFLNIVSGS